MECQKSVGQDQPILKINQSNISQPYHRSLEDIYGDLESIHRCIYFRVKYFFFFFNNLKIKIKNKNPGSIVSIINDSDQRFDFLLKTIKNETFFGVKKMFLFLFLFYFIFIFYFIFFQTGYLPK